MTMVINRSIDYTLLDPIYHSNKHTIVSAITSAVR